MSFAATDLATFGDGWQNYPSSAGENVLIGCNTELVRQKIDGDKGRLFVTVDEQFTIWFATLPKARLVEHSRASIAHSRLGEHALKDLTELKNCFLANTDYNGAFYIIKQANTWGRFLVTHEIFRRILCFHRVFPPFFDIVRAYGWRMKEDSWTGNYYQEHIASDFKKYEVCYNLRYFEENGRPNSYPWSLRQTGVYQQYDISGGRSNWMLLQPSQSILKSLREILRDSPELALSDATKTMACHAIIIACSVRTWKDYLDYLNTRIQTLGEKSCFVDADQRREHDYSVNLSVSQELELLRGKLLQALDLLDSSSGVITKCGKLYRASCKISRARIREGDRIISSMEKSASEVVDCRRATRSLLQRCAGLSGLLSSIIQYRNAKSTAVSLVEMRIENGLALKSAVTGQALTVIAAIYLPVSLVATVFSSNLIITRSKVGQADANAANDNSGPTYFVLATQFWKFVVVVLVLTLITFLFTVQLRRFLGSRIKRREEEERAIQSQETEAEPGG